MAFVPDLILIVRHPRDNIGNYLGPYIMGMKIEA